MVAPIKPELLSSNKTFDGWHYRYRHKSDVCQCKMTFALYLPPQAETHPVPVLYWLSGLTCTDENFMQKAGAQRVAAELGIAIVAPDTSPRGDGVPDDPEGAYDLGLGAGFYINATREPWARHYRMYDYVVEELPALVESAFAVTDRRAISGHSMGGHGALMVGLKNPGRYTSISAFSPVVNPVRCPWGIKAFSNYLGENRDEWKQYDSCELLAGMAGSGIPPVRVDQGDRDNFLNEQLRTENLERVLQETGHGIDLRYQPGYDHSYFFIASFIGEHLQFHDRHLRG